MSGDLLAWGLLLVGVLMIVLPLARMLSGPDEEGEDRVSRDWLEKHR